MVAVQQIREFFLSCDVHLNSLFLMRESVFNYFSENQTSFYYPGTCLSGAQLYLLIPFKFTIQVA
jgi:hypothetical protein